jgi:LmbE family N-acetylglucosaminyl deacetylase
VGQLGGKSLTFLGCVDPVVGPGEALFAPEHNPPLLAGQIVAAIKQFGAQVVLTHGSNGEYGHPAHQLMHNVAKVAVMSLGDAAPLLYSFAAAYPTHPYPRLSNADDAADFVVDVSAFLDKKEAAAHCHATQNALFVRRRSQLAGRSLSLREVLLTEEAFHRRWPAGEVKNDPFRRWLKE